MKAVRLAQNCILDGVPRAKGEHVLVEDNYNDTDLIDRTVATGIEKVNAARVEQAEKHEEVRITVKEINSITEQVAKVQLQLDQESSKVHQVDSEGNAIPTEQEIMLSAQAAALQVRLDELNEKLSPTPVPIEAPGDQDPIEAPVDEPLEDDPGVLKEKP